MRKIKDLTTLRERYFNILEASIVEPLRRDLLELQADLRQGAGARYEGKDAAMLEKDHQVQREKVDLALQFLDQELSRLKSLKLRKAVGR